MVLTEALGVWEHSFFPEDMHVHDIKSCGLINEYEVCSLTIRVSPENLTECYAARSTSSACTPGVCGAAQEAWPFKVSAAQNSNEISSRTITKMIQT